MEKFQFLNKFGNINNINNENLEKKKPIKTCAEPLLDCLDYFLSVANYFKSESLSSMHCRQDITPKLPMNRYSSSYLVFVLTLVVEIYQKHTFQFLVIEN